MKKTDMEEEPWEALDVDDSDISSSTSSSFSLLRRCTLQPPPPPSPQPPQSPFPQPQQPPSASRSPIPGPAGAIQAAMHRKTRFSSPRIADAGEISTQEYVRRVEEDDSEEFSRFGFTPLKDVKQCVNSKRIEKVVAIVKSCKPNGLGDMMVTLKDPTDTVGASVHRNVLSTGECGKLISVGSVLILEKVVAFHSSYASCYLNITRSNAVKVISVDCTVHSFPVAKADPFSVETPGLIHRRPETHWGSVEPGYISKGKNVAEELIGNENSSQAISLTSRGEIENTANKISKEPIHIDSVDTGPNLIGYLNKFRRNSWRNTQPASRLAESLARNKEDPDNAEKRSQVRDFSSAPITYENLDNRCAWLTNVDNMGSLLRGNNHSTNIAEKVDVPLDSVFGTSSSTAENLNDLNFSKANYIQTQRQHGETSPLLTMAENLANHEILETNDSQKRRQPADTTAEKATDKVPNVSIDVSEGQEANGGKKQRMTLISRTLVQEWTDEQLGILDMDED